MSIKEPVQWPNEKAKFAKFATKAVGLSVIDHRSEYNRDKVIYRNGGPLRVAIKMSFRRNS
jgi:hypothetical protein